MKIKDLHKWDISPKKAVEIQHYLAKDIIKEGEYNNINYAAGCDISFNKGSDKAYAVVVVLHYPDMELVEVSEYTGKALMPYIPGLLTFREGPLLIEALRGLKTTPDIFIYDGQGYAHPRRMGIATHMGIITGKPSIGCAKSLLVGEFDKKEKLKGNVSSIYHKDEIIGYALYTKNKCNPVYVSIGNKVSLDFAKNFVLSCVKNYKHPEPVRLAHIYSNKLRKKA